MPPDRRLRGLTPLLIVYTVCMIILYCTSRYGQLAFSESQPIPDLVLVLRVKKTDKQENHTRTMKLTICPFNWRSLGRGFRSARNYVPPRTAIRESVIPGAALNR